MLEKQDSFVVHMSRIIKSKYNQTTTRKSLFWSWELLHKRKFNFICLFIIWMCFIIFWSNFFFFFWIHKKKIFLTFFLRIFRYEGFFYQRNKYKQKQNTCFCTFILFFIPQEDQQQFQLCPRMSLSVFSSVELCSCRRRRNERQAIPSGRGRRGRWRR